LPGQRSQALSWPRWNVFLEGFSVSPAIVPADIANACADLALKAAAGDLNADLTRGVVRKKIGPLETEYDPIRRSRFAIPRSTWRSLPTSRARRPMPRWCGHDCIVRRNA
jgi:hypothetical protein